MNTEKAHKLHGVLLMALFSFAAFYIADFQVFRALKISPLIVGIILGMVYANTLREHLPETWVPGIKYTGKTILRLSIIFFGFRLTLTDVVAVGWRGVLIDTLVVSSVMLLAVMVGKLLRIDRNTALLIGSGSAVCGAAAVLGTEPVLDDKPYKTVVAVSTVVIFGTIAMFLYPSLYRAGVYDLTDAQVAVYTGSTLHEVAHVAGAGAAMGDAAIANLATITKMIRVILLAPLLLILGFVVRRKGGAGGRKQRVMIPWFAVWFLVVIGINSLLSFLASRYGCADGYAVMTKGIEQLDTFGLTMAMTALGAEASVAKFRQAGFKPFVLALALFAWLIVGGYWLTKLVY